MPDRRSGISRFVARRSGPPEVPIRQWVLSFLASLRYRLAYDSRLVRDVLGIFIRAVFASLRRRERAYTGIQKVRQLEARQSNFEIQVLRTFPCDSDRLLCCNVCGLIQVKLAHERMQPRVGAERIQEKIGPDRVDPLVVMVSGPLHPDKGFVDLAKAEM